MRKIVVTRGGCGIKYLDAKNRVRHAFATPESGPFECDDEQAARLVRLRVAKYVGDVKAEEPDTEPEKPAEPTVQTEEHEEPARESEKVYEHLSKEDLEKWEYNDLKKLAADLGVEPKGKKKADYIAAIVAVELEPDAEEDEEDPDELPELCAADPE